MRLRGRRNLPLPPCCACERTCERTCERAAKLRGGARIRARPRLWNGNAERSGVVSQRFPCSRAYTCRIACPAFSALMCLALLRRRPRSIRTITGETTQRSTHGDRSRSSEIRDLAGSTRRSSGRDNAVRYRGRYRALCSLTTIAPWKKLPAPLLVRTSAMHERKNNVSVLFFACN